VLFHDPRHGRGMEDFEKPALSSGRKRHEGTFEAGGKAQGNNTALPLTEKQTTWPGQSHCGM